MPSIDAPSLFDTSPQIGKRKRQDLTNIEIDTRPFTIRPEPSTPLASPRTFTPLSLLPRAQLPLASLDITYTGSQCFLGNINALSIADEADGAAVLLARDHADSRIYAVELICGKSYALSRLAAWVTEHTTFNRSTCGTRGDGGQTKRKALHDSRTGPPWWKHAAVETPILKCTSHHRPRLLNMSVEESAQTTQHTQSSKPLATLPDLAPEQDGGPVERRRNAQDSSSSPEQALKDLVHHYQDALYMSRTSLAYFAKGPLSRVRAFFSNSDSNSSPNDLALFLRGAILTSTIMDKKYRDSILDIVKQMPVQSPEQPVQSKQKRKWKAKRDKAGFWSDEKMSVEKWWRECGESVSGPTADNVEATVRKRVVRLRTRETFLQIILCLEILALEASASAHEQLGRDQRGSKPDMLQIEDPPNTTASKKTKTTKVVDIVGLLETLLDRLCIWHSLDTISPAKKAEDCGTNTNACTNDELKDFCTEVIVPFYVSRVARHANTVNRKLGGPSAPTPVKSKSAVARKPGEPAPRQALGHKARKPLARVSTDTRLDRSAAHPPSLHRSATDMESLPRIKRESSDVPLDSIPAAAQPGLVPRPARKSLLHTMSFNRREVDLSAMSQTSEAKMRKKADIDAKMQEAISTLRKPNRTLAVKEIAESTDETFARTMSKVKQRAKTVQRSVVVAATPKHGRNVDLTGYRRGSLVADKEKSSSSAQGQGIGSPYLPGSGFVVPETDHWPTRTRRHDETPTRGFAKFMPSGLARQPGTLDSPSSHRAMAVQGTPSKFVESNMSYPGGMDTITRERSRLLDCSSPEALNEASPNARRSSKIAGKVEPIAETSIYSSLGWDDDYEVLE